MAVSVWWLIRLHQNDDFIRYDAPKIVEFINNNETYIAIQYTTKDGETLYYDEKGVSRKRSLPPLPARLFKSNQ